jgi:hypothetical protein
VKDVALFLFSEIMDYQVMECRYNISPDDADIFFATNDRREAIEAAKEFGAGTVVLWIDEAGNKTRIFTASYESDLGIKK